MVIVNGIMQKAEYRLSGSSELSFSIDIHTWPPNKWG